MRLLSPTYPGSGQRVLLFIATIVLGHLIAYNVVHLPSQQEVVILFAALFFYPVLRFPSVGLVIFFSVMPLISYIRRLYYLQYARPTMDPLIMTGDILTGFMIIGLFFTFREKKERGESSHPMNRVVMVYLFYMVIRTFVLNSLPMAEAVGKFRFYGPAVLLFFIGTIFSGNWKLLKQLWFITIILGAGAALYGIYQSIFGFSEAEKIWFNSISFTSLFIKGVARPFSFFQSPAAFADYVILSTIGIIIILHSEKTMAKIFLLLLFPVLIYSVLITSVRSSWIGIFIVFVLWLIIFMLKNTRYRIILISTVFLLFALIQFANLYFDDSTTDNAILSIFGSKLNPRYIELMVTERAGGIANPFGEHSLVSRFALWRYLIVLCGDPVMALLGRGVGALNSDSLYFTYLAEFGFPGMIFIIVLYVYLIKSGLSCFEKYQDSGARSIVRGITIMNIVFAVMNLTGTHIHSFPGDAYFWFWNGVLIGMGTFKESSHEDIGNVGFSA